MITIFPALYNIRLKQGSSFNRKITVKNKNTGVLTNFTGYKARMDIRDKTTKKLLISLSTENSSITLSSQGVIEIKMTPAQTKKITSDECIYDLDIINIADGSIDTYLEGTIYVSAEVTI